MRFEDSTFLWLLWLVPILLLIWLFARHQRHNKLKKIGDAQLVKHLMPDVSLYRPHVKFSMCILSLILLVIVLARPQMGSKVCNEKRNGIEILIVMDISNSMKAKDVLPSRLDKAKLMVENIVDNFTNDKVGLIVFAGDAFVQLPITSDYVSAKMFLQGISPSLINTQGTDIAKAIELASHSFSQKEKIGKAIVLITDGEDHEGGATEAAKTARKKGINVFILGIGNVNGSPIPNDEGGYMTDRSGNTVMSALNEKMCQEIAQAGNGIYLHIDNTGDAENHLNRGLEKLQKGDSESIVYSEYSEQFQFFALIALFFLIAEVCVLEVSNPLFRNIKLFKRK